MDKNQTTLLSFFKGAKIQSAPKTKSENEGEISRLTTAESSPRNSAEPAQDGIPDKDSEKTKRAEAMGRLAHKRKLNESKGTTVDRVLETSDLGSSCSDESTSSSSDSDRSMREEKEEPRSIKKRRESIQDESATNNQGAVDVEAMFRYGSVIGDAPVVERGFQIKTQREKNCESEGAVLSTEEVDRMCRSVPPYVSQFIRLFYELSLRFDFPSWLNPKNLRDKNRRAPADPDYDVSTLFVPRKNGKVVEEGHCTPMLQQYWAIKEDHFNEIILFKVGKFYELFYIDAGIAQQVCQLKWMGHDRRAHVGFPETSLQNHAAVLIKEGYTVCVVEQTETVSEANQRSAKSSGTLVERKICEVFTTGTLIHEDMLSQGCSNYLCSLHVHSANSIGIVLVDSASGKFNVGTLCDLSAVKTVLYSYQPREIIFDSKNVTSEFFKSLHAFKESQGGGCVLTRWASSAEKVSGKGIPSINNAEVAKLIDSNIAVSRAVHAAVQYLDHLLLYEQVVMCSEFLPLPSAQAANGHMVMDSTVLSHLELLKDSEGGQKGSVLKFSNRTVTPFGSRLLQRWLCAPLTDAKRINDRLDAVDFLISKGSVRKRLEEKLSPLPDLERKLQRISAMALQQQRNAIYFGEVETKRIAGFLAFLESIESACALIEWLHAESSDASSLFKTLTLPDACVPIRHTVQKLRAQVDVKKEGYAPHPGAFKEHDDVVASLKALDAEFEHELSRVKAELNVKEAIFVSVKYVNEIELPVEFENKLKRHESLLSGSGEITSCRKGYVRFQTEEIKRLVEKHDQLEQEKKDLLYPFMARLFSEANGAKNLFSSLIDRIAQIDCLLALAKVSAGKNWSRPIFSTASNTQEISRMISLKNSRHPIQEHLMQLEREFVPNDVELNESILIVTGANMGGKSTILRQVCLQVIFAQMGCFVPCERMEMTFTVDRIFTRIGASDNILEGKSTFLTELEETAVMLKDATKRSLLVIDELGRGTSTYDGVAIAGATLKYISQSIGCNCLFATHYHKLCEEPWGSKAELYHMECLCPPSEEGGGIVLTHKFKKGLYPHSQALNVAKLAGLPPSILEEAKYISQKLNV